MQYLLERCQSLAIANTKGMLVPLIEMYGSYPVARVHLAVGEARSHVGSVSRVVARLASGSVRYRAKQSHTNLKPLSVARS